MDRPSTNTPCIQCHDDGKGHFCQAVLFVGTEALCLSCADGEPCLVAETKARTAKVSEQRTVKAVTRRMTIQGEEVVMSSHAVMGAEFIGLPATSRTVEPKKEKAMPEIEAKRQCKAEGCTHAASEKGSFCTKKHYYRLQKELGLAHAPKITRIPLTRANVKAPPVIPVTPPPARVPAAIVTVPLELTEELCNDIFNRLPLDQKGVALGAVLKTVLVPA